MIQPTVRSLVASLDLLAAIKACVQHTSRQEYLLSHVGDSICSRIDTPLYGRLFSGRESLAGSASHVDHSEKTHR